MEAVELWIRRFISARSRSEAFIEFVSSLPPRYALGVDKPLVVLLYMRLVAAARMDHEARGCCEDRSFTNCAGGSSYS